jgi:NAD(P)-dependent dehydrogenase (short-subunit alcohol dehydrogenase family)
VAEKRFENQVALITGGATGLGLAIAARLASEGARVAILDRDAEGLKDAVGSLNADRFCAYGHAVDIMDQARVIEAVKAVENSLGPVNVLVNSAGIVGPNNTKIVDYPLADFDRVYSINLRGSFVITKAVLPSMLCRNYGRILLIASIAGKEGNPGMCGYSATKSGVIGLVKGVAKEYAETGVTINGLAPAVVMTDMVRNMTKEQVSYMTAKIPMRRVGTLDEVALMSAWIVSRECSYSTGFIFDLSGGRAVY